MLRNLPLRESDIKGALTVDVSVVIVSYNAVGVLTDCLQSLHSHDWQNVTHETIVVDNGSTDGSLEYLRGVTDLKLIDTGANLGFAGGNNVGVQAAKGRYVLLLNSDTLLHPGAMVRLVEAADSNPNAGVVGPRLLNRDLTLQGPCARALPSVWSVWVHQLFLDKMFPTSQLFGSQVLHWALRDRPTHVGSVSGAALLMPRHLYLDLGGLDTNFFMYYEDTDLCKRSWDAGRSVLYVPDSEIVHLWGGSTRNRVRGHVMTHESLIRYFRKHRLGPSWLLHLGLIVGSLIRLLVFGCAYPLKPSTFRERLQMAVGVLKLAVDGEG